MPNPDAAQGLNRRELQEALNDAIRSLNLAMDSGVTAALREYVAVEERLVDHFRANPVTRGQASYTVEMQARVLSGGMEPRPDAVEAAPVLRKMEEEVTTHVARMTSFDLLFAQPGLSTASRRHLEVMSSARDASYHRSWETFAAHLRGGLAVDHSPSM